MSKKPGMSQVPPQEHSKKDVINTNANKIDKMFHRVEDKVTQQAKNLVGEVIGVEFILTHINLNWNVNSNWIKY